MTDRETSLDECLRHQASCMRRRKACGLADCDFYHSKFIPGVGEIIGLCGFAPNRRRTRIDFAGKRVLEIGPASGFLSHRNGTARRGRGGRRVPRKTSAGTSCRFRRRSLPRSEEKQIAGMPRLKNSFWFNHAAKQIEGEADPRGHLQPARDRRVRRRRAGVGAPALSVSGENHLPECAKRCRSILITELYYPEMYRRCLRTASATQENEAMAHLVALSAGILYRLFRRDRLRRHEGDIPRAPAHAGAGTHVPDVLGRGSRSASVGLARVAQTLGGFEIDRDELAHAALGHGDAEQPAHARHGERMMGDDQEPRVGLLAPSPPSAGRSARHWRRRAARPPRRARRSARGW